MSVRSCSIPCVRAVVIPAVGSPRPAAPLALAVAVITAGPSEGNRVDASFSLNSPGEWDGYDSLQKMWTLDGVFLMDYDGNEFLPNDFAYHGHTVGYREIATNATGSTTSDSNTFIPDLRPITTDVPVLPDNFSISTEGTSIIDLSSLADMVWTNTSPGDTVGFVAYYDGGYFNEQYNNYLYDVSGHEGQQLQVTARRFGTCGDTASAFSNFCIILS